ncbi:hypothetical protein H6G33_09235 [Calothrix sp. FACHB-1219]|uniref:hypothetical protein n=1 Tax=unclassified Calothrix TaxID=2619626 RepID=UPI0016822AB6|nr:MULTISPECIES: hypothetical protein [unclassified Calothrix]MBD2201528.1 hypothetical protein [Calothrix sp. FACHB-168]MBD2217214.1 hypothetical protein [Calothrix sp. FACHB-1219]
MNAAEFIIQSEPGTSLWDWVQVKSLDSVYIPTITNTGILSTDYFPVFLIKVNQGESWTISNPPQAHIKIGMYRFNNVVPIYVLIKVSGIDFIHEVWINHCSQDTPSPLAHLSRMKYIHIFLYESNTQPERTIKFVNNFTYKSIIEEIRTAPRWSNLEFDQAKEIAPSKDILWQYNM